MGFSFSPATRGGGVGGLLFFTLFWCGITGIFVGVLGNSVYRSLDAQRRYAATTGTVLASRVQEHSGKSTSYGFDIRYRYVVNDQSLESQRYTFGALSSSDGYQHANALVNQYPPGSTIRVYYDPQKPSEAVIDRVLNPVMGFLFLFLQPFILVGLGMLSACVCYPFTRHSFNRFLNASSTELPAAIPSWGTLLQVPNGYLIQPHIGVAEALTATAVGYGFTCFVSIFVVGFLFGGFSHPNLKVVGGALIVALTAGIGFASYTVWSSARKARLLIDVMYRRVVLVRAQQAEEIAFRDIAGWIVLQTENPRAVKQQGAPLQVPVLSIRKITNEDVPVHIFEATADAPLIAAKSAEILARLADNKPVLAELRPDAETLPPTVAGILDAMNKAAAKAKVMKDLT